MALKSLVPLDMGSQKITGLADPTSAQDAATKTYVDAGGASSPIVSVLAPGFGVKADYEELVGTVEMGASARYGYVVAGTNTFTFPTQLGHSSVVGMSIGFPDSRSFSQGSGTGDGRQSTGANFLRTITAQTALTVTFDGAAIANAIGVPADTPSPAPFYAPCVIYAASPTVGFTTTAGSTSATHATRNFQTTDIGKVIEIACAGPNFAHFYGTIAGGTPGTGTYTLSVAAGSTVKGAACRIATDDTVAIQAVLDAHDAVYFPEMSAMVNGLRMNEGQHIFGAGPGPQRPGWTFPLATTMTNASGTAVINGTIPAAVQAYGFARIGRDDLGWEIVRYTSFTGSTFTLDTRGAQGTNAFAHTGGAVGEQVVILAPGATTGGVRLYQRGASVATGNALPNAASIKDMISGYSARAANAQAQPVRNVVIEGIRLVGSGEWDWGGDGQPGQTQNKMGMHLGGAQGWVIRNVISEGFDGDGAYVGRGSLADAPCLARDNSFYNVILQYNCRNGIMESDCDNTLMQDCILQWCQTALSPYDRKWMGSSSAGSTYVSALMDKEPNIAGQISNNGRYIRCIYRYSLWLGVQVSRPTAGCQNWYGLWQDCIFIDCVRGGFESATNNFQKSRITGCTFIITTMSGTTIARHLRLSAGSDAVIDKNKFIGTGNGAGSGKAIQLDNGNGTTQRITISDNYFDLGGNGTSDDKWMFRTADATGPTKVERNYFANMSVTLKTGVDLAKDNVIGPNVVNGSNVAAMKTRQQGVATVPTGGAVTVNHTLAEAPTTIQLTPQSDPGNLTNVRIYVTAITSTQFTINITPAPAAGVVVAYDAATAYEQRY